MLARVDELAEEVSRRRGALAAAIGRTESRVRALRETAPEGASTRLYEVIRARPGYEVAVEAALGEYGAGVLAENLDEGMKLLSSVEPVAVRLDARAMEANGSQPGKPLIECVEVLDARYDDAVRRLLTGIFVVERPGDGANANGYVAVTRDGFRLTRTGVSLRPGPGNFARETQLAAWMERLEALKDGPGGGLYDIRETVAGVSNRLERLAGTVHGVSMLAERTERARALISRLARRGRMAGENSRRALLERERCSLCPFQRGCFDGGCARRSRKARRPFKGGARRRHRRGRGGRRCRCRLGPEVVGGAHYPRGGCESQGGDLT